MKYTVSFFDGDAEKTNCEELYLIGKCKRIKGFLEFQDDNGIRSFINKDYIKYMFPLDVMDQEEGQGKE